MRRGVLALLLGLGLLAGGCHTAVGNYFANRGRDFTHCFRAEVAQGIGFGVGIRAGGVVCVGVGGFAGELPVGWGYGGRMGSPVAGAGVVDLWFPFTLLVGSGAAWHAHLDQHASLSHFCWGVLSAFASAAGGSEPPWFWWPGGDPRARLHAFDVEIAIYAFEGAIWLGFSPGEFFDFLLGWFGLDIAGDDLPLAPPASAPPE